MGKHAEVRLPDIGDYKDVPIVEILVKPGDKIKVDMPLMTVESDKATMEIPAPFAGTVHELSVKLGDKVSKGSMLLVIDTDAEAEVTNEHAPPASPPKKAASEPAPRETALPILVPSMPTAVSVAQAHATPSVRAFAHEVGVDLAAVTPSGPKGRILRDDVAAHIKARIEGQAGRSGIGAGLPARPSVDFEKFGPVVREPLSRIQKISGDNLLRNWLTIPHVTNFDKADVTALEAFRKELNAGAKSAAKVTMVAFLIKASVFALRAFPRFNASLDGDHLILKDYVHVGFAADTPRGLMVPVIRDCDRKGVRAIADEVADLADKARAGCLPASNMQGGCFSVSSLGGIGGAGFTPIINAPEVAILGAGRSATEPVWTGDRFEPRSVLPITLSWDHRVVDGVAAAKFLGHISALLSDFRRAVV